MPTPPRPRKRTFAAAPSLVARLLLGAALTLATARPLQAQQDASDPPAATTDQAGGSAHAPTDAGGAAPPGAPAAHREPVGADGTPASGRVAPDELEPQVVARIGDRYTITEADFERYLATTYARLPEGDAALDQVLAEALLDARAAQAGMSASDEEVARTMASLDEESRSHGGAGLFDSVTANVGRDAVRDAVRLLVLQEKLVRAADGLSPDAPIPPERLAEWLAAQVSGAALAPAPLDSEDAATWTGGTLSKQAVGRRVGALLPPESLAGVLTEMIGVQLVREEALRSGVSLTTADATQEILLRDAILRSQPGAGDTTYDQFAEVVLKRSLAEVLASDKFSAELLLRLIAEKRYTEADAQAFYERNKAGFEAGKVTGPWEAVRGTVWRELRQQLYREIFRKSTIVRRF